jgi:hypothetical protein
MRRRAFVSAFPLVGNRWNWRVRSERRDYMVTIDRTWKSIGQHRGRYRYKFNIRLVGHLSEVEESDEINQVLGEIAFAAYCPEAGVHFAESKSWRFEVIYVDGECIRSYR